MKPAKEAVLKFIFDNEFITKPSLKNEFEYLVDNLVKQAKSEAIKETVKACSEAAQVPYLEHGMTQLAARSKELILEVADKLKAKL